MIKYVVIPEKRTVVGILENTDMDAYHKINKMIDGSNILIDFDKYLMPNRFKVSVVCDESDEFNEEVGKNMAKERLMRKYYKSLDSRLLKFKNEIKIINEKIFTKSLDN